MKHHRKKKAAVIKHQLHEKKEPLPAGRDSESYHSRGGGMTLLSESTGLEVETSMFIEAEEEVHVLHGLSACPLQKVVND